MSWIITIPQATPSPNELNKMHFMERHRLKQTFGWLLAGALNKQPKIPKATGPRILIIERHGKKAMDQDNLAGGCKALIDCIKDKGLILDDSPDLCRMEFRQVVSRQDGAFTVIYLGDAA